MASGFIGGFNHRIIIPVTMNNRILSWVGRDVTGKANIPYKNSPDYMCIKDPKTCLYNMDNVIQEKAVIVEGIFDAWRIGDGAIATFGTKYTHEQLLYCKNLKRVFVLYDADAKHLVDKLAASLSSLVKEVKIISLSEGDPDNLTDDDVRSLRKEIGL
jgi:DNA primase